MLSEDKAPAEHLLLEKGVPEAEKKNLEGNVKEAAETSCPRPEPREGEGRTVDPPHDALDSEEGGRGAGEEGRHSRDAGDLARHSPASVEGGDGGEMTKEKEGSTSLLLDGEDTVTEKCPTPDLSDPTETFFDLLCQFQSRRMNDQRCSFRRKPRGDTRPWRSAPSSPVGERRAVFASALSLQTEEFFDLVAWSQARRLDDQRAEPLENELRAAEPRDGREAGRLAEREARKTWRKVRQRAVTEPCAAPDEELYNTILTHQSSRNLQEYQNQAKQLFRKLSEHSPSRCSLEAGPMTFHYLISQGVCYLMLCNAGYSKKLAFAYLEELQVEFSELYGKKVASVSRPYAFIEFDTYIQKLKKSYVDSWSKRHLSSINTELQDVQKIMVTNIEEVLQRGEALSALDSKASNLSSLSRKYRKDAQFLNTRSTYAKVAASGIFLFMVLMYLRFWWLV